jgi:hypothetical protein
MFVTINSHFSAFSTVRVSIQNLSSTILSVSVPSTDAARHPAARHPAARHLAAPVIVGLYTLHSPLSRGASKEIKQAAKYP